MSSVPFPNLNGHTPGHVAAGNRAPRPRPRRKASRVPEIAELYRDLEVSRREAKEASSELNRLRNVVENLVEEVEDLIARETGVGPEPEPVGFRIHCPFCLHDDDSITLDAGDLERCMCGMCGQDFRLADGLRVARKTLATDQSGEWERFARCVEMIREREATGPDAG